MTMTSTTATSDTAVADLSGDFTPDPALCTFESEWSSPTSR